MNTNLYPGDKIILILPNFMFNNVLLLATRTGGGPDVRFTAAGSNSGESSATLTLVLAHSAGGQPNTIVVAKDVACSVDFHTGITPAHEVQAANLPNRTVAALLTKASAVVAEPIKISPALETNLGTSSLMYDASTGEPSPFW